MNNMELLDARNSAVILIDFQPQMVFGHLEGGLD
jgi:nicotinamidase-related amidase